MFVQTAPNEVAASIDALQALYAHLSDYDARYNFYEKCQPFCEWLEAQNFATLEALQKAIDDASDDAPETIWIGHYTEETVSDWQYKEDIALLRLQLEESRQQTRQAQALATKAQTMWDKMLGQRNHWRDRAFQMLSAAKGYQESYLHSCGQWVVLREQYNEMQDYYDAMHRESCEQLAKSHILHLAFLAAGIGLGLIIHHFIF